MKENIYTIPINDILLNKCGCAICRLEKVLDENALAYCMGAAMMEPDVRIKTNKLGFCKSHLNSMLNMKNRLSLALLLKSHMQEVNANNFNNDEIKNSFPSSNCFVCQIKLDYLINIIINMTHLYSTDIQFKNSLLEQEFFCLTHYNLICKVAKKHLKKKVFNQFVSDIKEINQNHYNKLMDSLDEYCNLYDYRNSNKNNNNETVTQSVENIILFLTRNN